MEEKIENVRIEKNTKYRILINYLKGVIEREAYISSEEIKKLLKAFEEVE